MNDSGFWTLLDELIAHSSFVIDRPQGSVHPRYPDVVYPLDYGFLESTQSMDREGIDVWFGSLPDQKLDTVVCTVDLIKRDCELKLLLGCTEEEKNLIQSFHNSSDSMQCLLVRR